MRRELFLIVFSTLFFGLIFTFFAAARAKNPAVHSFSKTTWVHQTLSQTTEQKLYALHNSFHVSSSTTFTSQAYANGTTPYDGAEEYVAIDNNTGSVLLEKNMQYSVSIASLTKIMTAVVALDLAKPTDQITISQKAAEEFPTTIGVVPGQQMTVAELLHGMLMTSANDAAQAVADGINAKYGSDIFIQAMNKKAELLGLTHTHFANPEGFDNAQNYSSAQDLAILAHYALTNYPTISDIVKQDYLHMDATASHKQFDLNNWNGLLGVYPGVYGMKIGNTGGAGYTTIVAAKRNGKDILAVLLNAPGVLERDEWTAQLLDDAFGKFGIPPANITQDELQAKYATWQYYN